MQSSIWGLATKGHGRGVIMRGLDSSVRGYGVIQMVSGFVRAMEGGINPLRIRGNTLILNNGTSVPVPYKQRPARELFYALCQRRPDFVSVIERTEKVTEGKEDVLVVHLRPDASRILQDALSNP